MKIKLIDYGYEHLPKRAHYNDAGADVYAMEDIVLLPNEQYKMPLGYGLQLPDGFAAFVMPRSGLANKGIVCELAPIDSGYTGEIHAQLSNVSNRRYHIHKGDRIGQLVIMPVILTDFTIEDFEERGNTGFGASGK